MIARGIWLVVACVLAVVARITPAVADEIEMRTVQLEVLEDSIVVNADFEFDLTARLEDALHNGVPLYFVVEFEATRPRWYWFDERVGSATLPKRLAFHALTRTYRLSAEGSLAQSFLSLSDALRAMGLVRRWRVLPRAALAPDATYQFALRMRLDVNQLPKPFQVSALANREWTLASPWWRWESIGKLPEAAP